MQGVTTQAGEIGVVIRFPERTLQGFLRQKERQFSGACVLADMSSQLEGISGFSKYWRFCLRTLNEVLVTAPVVPQQVCHAPKVAVVAVFGVENGPEAELKFWKDTAFATLQFKTDLLRCGGLTVCLRRFEMPQGEVPASKLAVVA